MNATADLMRKAMDENARVAQDQNEYEKKYTALERHYNKADAAYKAADAQIERQKARSRQLGGDHQATEGFGRAGHGV